MHNALDISRQLRLITIAANIFFFKRSRIALNFDKCNRHNYLFHFTITLRCKWSSFGPLCNAIYRNCRGVPRGLRLFRFAILLVYHWMKYGYFESQFRWYITGWNTLITIRNLLVYRWMKQISALWKQRPRFPRIPCMVGSTPVMLFYHHMPGKPVHPNCTGYFYVVYNMSVNSSLIYGACMT